MGSNGSIPGPRILFAQELVARLMLGSSPSPILCTWFIYKIVIERKNTHKRRESRKNTKTKRKVKNTTKANKEIDKDKQK